MQVVKLGTAFMTKVLPPEKHSKRVILAYISIWVVAFLIRAVYLWHLGKSPAFSLLLGDAVTYDQWAKRIAAGDWFGQGVFYQAPLYPYFLGVLYSVLGRDFLIIRLIQIAIGAGSCVLLAFAGRMFFDRVAPGFLAGLLLAVYPTAIFFDCSIQKSVLDLFFVCALLALLAALSQRPQKKPWWLAAGIVLGLLALTRENALVFLPIVLVWVFISRRIESMKTRLRWAGLFLLGTAAVLLPVGWRNLKAGGEFHLTTAQFGPNFYIGNNKAAKGFYEALKEGRGNAIFEREDATKIAEQATGRKLKPSEVSGYWTDKAWIEIRADLPRWVRLIWKKWMLVWNVSEIGDSDDQYTYGDWSPLLQFLNPLLNFGTLCPLALFGICLTWERRKHLWLLYAMMLFYAGSVALFYVFSRYRFPLVPILILFTAAGMMSMREAFRKSQRRPLWAGAATAVVAAAVCNQAIMPEATIRAGTHINLGNAFIMEDRVQDAIGQYEQALQFNPNDPYAPLNLAKALMRVGRFEDAIGPYGEALRIEPDNARAHYDLGISLCKVGKPSEAVPHFEQALRIDPNYAEAHHILGSVLYDQGKTAEAMEHWEQAVRINPAFAEPHYNLGNAFLRRGQFQEAIKHYEEALKIKPDFAVGHYNLGIALEQAGRVQAAIEQYEQALSLKPGFVELQKRVAQLRAGAPRHQNAR